MVDLKWKTFIFFVAYVLDSRVTLFDIFTNRNYPKVKLLIEFTGQKYPVVIQIKIWEGVLF